MIKLLKSNFVFPIILIILLYPSFHKLLKPGIFSMHDFHVFRLYEFDKCVADVQIPCRWAPDTTYEYGQPHFNFYGQFSFALGQIFRLLGFSVLDSVKLLFASSLVIGALGVYWLGKQLWGNNLAGLLSALFYTYAPYRSVDIYVRGALPEAMAFIFFPFIVLFFNKFVITKKNTYLLLFSFFFAGLIATHNLSALMFSFFLFFWSIFYLTKEKAWRLLSRLSLGGLLVIGLTAYYILPVLFESKYVTINNTFEGYYVYSNHFVNFYNLLISRFWGYGPAGYNGNDLLSLSVGQFQWILPLLILLFILIKKPKFKEVSFFLVLIALGWLMVWMINNSSILVWKLIPPLKFLQFPWRFLGQAVFAFSLSAGMIFAIFRNRLLNIAILIALSLLVILFNFNFFKEDQWFYINDSDFFSGENYLTQVAAIKDDFWPTFAKKVPSSIPLKVPIFLEGSGSGVLTSRTSKRVDYNVSVNSEKAVVSFPNVFFPGWIGDVNNQSVSVYSAGDYGLITLSLDKGINDVSLKFTNTLVRIVGDIVSLGSLIILILLLVYFKAKKNEN